ncbi:MAG: hypothetical protein U0359_03510 [Byssovorax sp.]
MRFRAIGLLIAFWAGASLAACSTPPSTSTSSSTGTTGTGGAPNCDGLWFVSGSDGGHPCEICMHEKCCAEWAACGEEHCLECASGGGDPCCNAPCADVDLEWHAARRCASEKCGDTCFPTCVPGFCPDGGDGG